MTKLKTSMMALLAKHVKAGKKIPMAGKSGMKTTGLQKKFLNGMGK